MELLKRQEIASIVKQYGFVKVLNWSVENYSDELIGYLGEHLRLIVHVESNGLQSELKLFVKCIPRHDKWKADYLKELNFFKKEYVMLSDVFNKFENDEGTRKWRLKLLFIKEELFVFEDVTQIGYSMPCHLDTMKYKEIIASVETLARFHAQSYIYEEKRTRELNKPYRIWDDYSEYLQEPNRGQNWRRAGQNAVVAFLKVYSQHKFKPEFSERLETIVPILFDGAIDLMKPSSEYRNVVIHRDLWSNNIFLADQKTKLHALFVDFQTVLYCSPMLDLSSLLYFNTTRTFRDNYIAQIKDVYYEVLSDELKSKNLDINEIFNKTAMMNSYEESIVFGITQAALIVPIIAMSTENRQQLFSNPKTCKKLNEISRSDEFIEIARADINYRHRVTDLFDEIVDRYVYPKTNNEYIYEH